MEKELLPVKDQYIPWQINIKNFVKYFLEQLTTFPTRGTCNTSSIIDHVLSNSNEKIFHPDIIDWGMSDHQLIFWTKTGNEQSLISIKMFFWDSLSTTQSMCLSKKSKNSISQTMNVFLVQMENTLIFLTS